MKFNLSKIMHKAWTLHRSQEIDFAESLRRAWASAKAEPINGERIIQAKAAAGIAEEVHTWSDWRDRGYEVRHGSKALFGVELIHASKGAGAVYNARFFGASQVQPIGA